MSVVRNITKWLPPSGAGYVTSEDADNLVTNDDYYLVTNDGYYLVTNDTSVIGKYSSTWIKSLKNTVSWVKGDVIENTSANIADQFNNLLIDQSGNFVVGGSSSVVPKQATVWTGSGV